MIRKNTQTSLKWQMIVLLLTGWLLPVIAASVAIALISLGRTNEQLRENVVNSTDKAVAGVEKQIESIMAGSRNATYFNVIAEDYEAYRNDRDGQKLYDNITLYLAQQYRYDNNINSTMVVFTENAGLFYSTYSAGNTYDSVLLFRQDYLQDALARSKELDTSMYYVRYGNSFYLMRNLVDSAYKPYAMIIMDLNTDSVFNGLSGIWGYEDACVCIDGEAVYGSMTVPQKIDVMTRTRTPVFEKIGGSYYVYYTDNLENQMISYVVRLDTGVIRAEFVTVLYILLVTVLSCIPLGIGIYLLFENRVNRPVRGLLAASGEISNEHYGYHIEEAGGSLEFNKLILAYNDMSDVLKTQFEQIYLEELAIRDANIKALQSQINPHFINNTLEIINWEARLNGVYKVSNMIEALSTMLNATLDRRNVQTILLSEELEYVDAYLYIISSRMGNRLEIIRETDEELLRTYVPRLIAQPVIENAVEHGIKTTGKGTIKIRIYAEDEYTKIEIRNTGRMSAEDEEKVRSILSADNTEPFYRSLSIGINNVNKRLKLMYGEECGLTIYNDGDETVNLLTIRREETDEN